MAKPPFDANEDFTVATDFILHGRKWKRGEAFDTALASTRLLRRLYDIGLLRFKPRSLSERHLAHPDGRDQRPVTFVSTALRTRRRAG